MGGFFHTMVFGKAWAFFSGWLGVGGGGRGGGVGGAVTGPLTILGI